MANGFYLTNAVAAGMLNSTGLAESLGARIRRVSVGRHCAGIDFDFR